MKLHAIYGTTYKDLEKENKQLREKIKYHECFIYHLKKDKKELQQKIDKAISYIYLLKNNVRDYEIEYKEDFLNMLDELLEILGNKE